MKRIMEHGGDWTGRLLDFSANVSPLGLPEGVRQAAAKALERSDRYPDPLCRDLRRAIGEAEGVPAAWCLCGNGAADLIFRAALAARPQKALVTAPAFSEYEAALRTAGCGEIERYPLRPEEDFRLGEDFLNALTPGTELAFLCQPNNPTGVTVEKKLLCRILDRCGEINCRLVLDECFLNFLDVPEAYTLKPRLGERPGLLLLRAFTKFCAMAGLRLGYALCADEDFLEAMRRAGQPWSVSAPAQAAGMAALREREYGEALRALVSRERPRMLRGLRELGLRTVPGEANFLLFQSPVPLDEPLRERGLLLRSCGGFHGLDGSWYRAALRREEENDRLLEALGEVLR